MPAFGTNANVMCYIDDIFVYLRARANDAVGRVRPAKREAQTCRRERRRRTSCFGKKR